MKNCAVVYRPEVTTPTGRAHQLPSLDSVMPAQAWIALEEYLGCDRSALRSAGWRVRRINMPSVAATTPTPPSQKVKWWTRFWRWLGGEVTH
jgi:hypothetical protein